MARRLAVVVNHAPGLSGTPCSGHFSSAARRLSCTTSSAMSKLPIMRSMAPVSRPASSRKTAASAISVAVRRSARASVFHDRADFDARQSRPGLGDLECLVKVFHVELRIPADDFLRFYERPVDHHGLAVLETDRGRGLWMLELMAADDLAGLGQLGEPTADTFIRLLQLGILLSRVRLHVAAQQQHVLHR